MTILLHDLAGADPARRFSPYCWRIRMALVAETTECEEAARRIARFVAGARYPVAPLTT